MKAEKLRELGKDEVEKKIQDLRIELKNLRFGKAKGEDKNPLKRRIVRREIARVLTVQKEKGWN